MKIIIVGAGVVGAHLAKQLIAQGHEIVVIEPDEAVAFHLKNRLDCLVINEEGNSSAVLEKSGVAGADFLITVTHSDELNLLICGIVKSVGGKPVKIARIRNIRYASPETYLDNFKVDFVVNPEAEATRAVIRIIESNALGGVLEFAHTPLQIRNMIIDHTSPICGEQIQDIMPRIEKHFLFSLIYRNNRYIIPKGNTVIQQEDVVYIAAEEEDFAYIYRAFGIHNNKVRKIIIAGGGRIGRAIARHILSPSHTNTMLARLHRMLERNMLTIVEKDYQQAQKLATEFPDALVINGDISNNDLFVEEDLASADLLIAATGNEEINLLSSTYGKSIGIKRALAVVSKTHYPVIAHKLKIDATVSIKNTIVNAIIQRIHRGHISSIHSLLGEALEVLELDVGENSKLADTKLKDMPLSNRCIVITIIRGDRSQIPRGEFIIREHDQIVVIVEHEWSEELDKLVRSAPAL